MNKDVIILDFVEHDSIAALEFLKSKFVNNEASGMVFALKLKHKHGRPCFTGATGSLATNAFEGSGVAGVLHLQMAQHANDY